ncbi:MAG: GNAT family N-acetyltransferase, partial [Dehalococcoidia bacterium]
TTHIPTPLPPPPIADAAVSSVGWRPYRHEKVRFFRSAVDSRPAPRHTGCTRIAGRGLGAGEQDEAMPVLKCVCGLAVEGEEEESLFQAMLAHTRAAHADLSLSDAKVRDFVQADIRLSHPWQPVTSPGPIAVKALTPELLTDYLRFFDEEPFSDRPDWLSCYCVSYCIAHTYADEMRRTARDNRALALAMVPDGRLTGFLAYAGERPVGWCNAGPRSLRPGLSTSVPRVPADENGVGAIVCISISAPYRGHGIARRLIDAACDGFRAEGLRIAEAYPSRNTGLGTGGYHGSFAMYEASGFLPVLEGERYTVVRKELTGTLAS